MDLRRLGPLVLVIGLVIGACANDNGSLIAEPETQESVAEDDDVASGDEARPSEDEQRDREGRKGSTSGGGGTQGSRSSGSGGDKDGEPAGEDDGSSTYFPAQGLYTHRQSGFEEFCDASRCEKEDLPTTQDVRTIHERRSGNEVVVVTEARTSDSRTTRVTTRHTPDRALITNVRIKFDYEGFNFDNSYQPEPPVESARYPLRTGDSWSGSWKDSTSGDYSIEVGPKESISVGGRTVQAFPLHTVTTFEGEFDGRGDVTVWIDPATGAVVRTEGKLEVTSVFGTYRTEFSATLRSGPGYR